MFFKSVVAAALLATSVSAQAGANSTIDPSTVDTTLRSQWCAAQQNTCGTLCSGEANSNTCDSTTLSYNCTCTSNNSAPGLQYYEETMPTFICELNFQRCIANTVGVAASQAKCNQDEKENCGHIDPASFVEVAATTSSSSVASTSTSSGASVASTAASPSTTSSKGAAATMLAVGGEYGAGIVAAGVAAAFGLML